MLLVLWPQLASHVSHTGIDNTGIFFLNGSILFFKEVTFAEHRASIGHEP